VAADWLWREGRMRHVHVKDYDGQLRTPEGRRRYLAPGEGHIDFAWFFGALAERGFRGSVSLEASAVGPDGGVDLDRLQTSLVALQRWIHSSGERSQPSG
jgi:sugar phosphate isomerase/epimerase